MFVHRWNRKSNRRQTLPARNTNEKDPGNTRGDTTPAARAPQTIQPTTPTAIQQPKTIIFTNVKKAYLFPPEKPKKPRRFTPYEWETEKQIASWLKRPMRYFATDDPFYPWVPPEPLVNFDIVTKYSNKGQH
nr:MAG: hypothetical protein [Betatorquevirus sp.]